MAETQECWHCLQFIGQEDFCGECGKIQPFAESPDYFRFLGYVRILNIDTQEMEQRYYKLSKQYHPDFYHKTGEDEKEIALSKAAYLTRAYKTLQDPFSRVDYLLELLGEKDDKNKNQVPPEILMEVSELHEKLDDFQHAADTEREDIVAELEENIRELKRRVKTLKDELCELLPQWDAETADVSCDTKPIIGRMQQILGVRSYLRTLIRTMRETISNGSN